MLQKVNPLVFQALQNNDIAELAKCTPAQLRPILPCLVRMTLISLSDTTSECLEGRKVSFTALSGIEKVNSIVALLSIDFHLLEADVKKEQIHRQKFGAVRGESVLVPNIEHSSLILEFERSDCSRRLRLVIYELLIIQAQIAQQNALLQQQLAPQSAAQRQANVNEFVIKQSDLFDHAVYLSEICDTLAIMLSELPPLLHIDDVVETLLHVKYGPDIICWVLANFPFSFRDVCFNLILKSDVDENSNRSRVQTLLALSQMDPTYSLMIRQKCVELSKLPALAVLLSLQKENLNDEGDLIAFISGLLLSNDQSIRNWFQVFVRTGQKRKGDCHTALSQLRDELLKRLQLLLSRTQDEKLLAEHVVQASALLRLYCALRGIAGIKYQDEEVNLLVQLVTRKPPVSPAGVRFISIGLCMLLACPSLTAHTDHEKCCIEWVQWLVKQEEYFECVSGGIDSFGEMLLLMAIHFHSNQLSLVCDLVCSTLGMKVATRQNNMSRMKQIFTQEIFTEQVVASHAIKVPVTTNLNANITGFLPIHCIYHLLKSRAFAKHRVPIKYWIYRQICNSGKPLHPVIPLLIDAYINSILVPNTKNAHLHASHPLDTHVNEPISEQEIRYAFKDTVFGEYFDFSTKTFLHGDQTSLDAVEEQYAGGARTGSLKPNLTSQILLLYYLLNYEDVRLNNLQTNSDRKIKSYSTEFLTELPIKYLLQQAQFDQSSYSLIFGSLLRLLYTHFPQLSLADDWIDGTNTAIAHSEQQSNLTITKDQLKDAFDSLESIPHKITNVLKKLSRQRAIDIWPLAAGFVEYFKVILDDHVPRHVQELYKEVWLKLNTVLPRCLWQMTVVAQHDNSFRKNLTSQRHGALASLIDPLDVLRCDPRVYRCAPALAVLLRVLQAYLAASRSELDRKFLDEHCKSDNNTDLNQAPKTLVSDSDRNELKQCLVITQESASIQILLEACLEKDEDRQKPGQIFALREIRSLICSFIHQMFIINPELARLVHFQTYPRQLLFVTVAGIPSMHICLDFIPELLSQPCLDKQIFAVDLMSHLSLQYALPKALSIARLVLNTLTTLLGVLPINTRMELFLPVLPAFTRIAEAFPTLVEDIIELLMLLGRVCKSQASANSDMDSGQLICDEVKKTFSTILSKAVLMKNIY